ncbi:MAG: hypothetical protein H6Q90_6437 [Deltaproteobacteria bacterium]|nr:hypothetical protein [Deltaproteobacteria bacterium]
MRWIRFPLLAVLAIGCSKPDPGPSCTLITDHMLEVTKQEILGHGDELLGQRTQLIASCEQRQWSADQRRCLMAAKDLAGFAACRAGPAPDAPAEKPRKPRTPAGSAPSPVTP